MKVYAFDSADWAEAAEHGLTKKEAIAAVERGLAASAKSLPKLSKHVNIMVRPHTQGIIPEYGTGAYTHDSEFIEIVFDKTVPHGAKDTLESLYRTVFHEANHAARWNCTKYDERFVASVVFEGLATVFERDHAGYQPLYGQYEDDETMKKWLAELQAANWDKRSEWFFRHPDGRRWIGYKTGTWLIDKAVKRSGQSVIELTELPADDIFAAAGITV